MEVPICHRTYFRQTKEVDREERRLFLRHRGGMCRRKGGHGEGLGDLKQGHEGSSTRSKTGVVVQGSRRAGASQEVESWFGWGSGYVDERGSRAVVRAQQEGAVGDRGLRNDRSGALK